MLMDNHADSLDVCSALTSTSYVAHGLLVVELFLPCHAVIDPVPAAGPAAEVLDLLRGWICDVAGNMSSDLLHCKRPNEQVASISMHKDLRLFNATSIAPKEMTTTTPPLM